MERKEFSIARFLSSKSRFDNIVLLEGFIVGILAGIVGVVIDCCFLMEKRWLIL